jgi:shikimate 5-dehydrogenase
MQSYIIGYPLKKPRSVPLWKNYFQKYKMNVRMKSLELKPIDLKKFILSKKNDNLFLASAVTMPFKKDIILYCKYGDKITQKCRSANLIIRYKKKLFCYNTDIKAAIESLPKKKYLNIMIFGLGGVGEPLFNVLKSKYPAADFYLITKKKNHILKKKKSL